MSSVGQALGGIVGGAIGFFLGSPLYGAQIGMMIGGAIDPPKGPTINGPRLDDLSVQTSTYGAPIPRNYGTIAQTGNVFWLQGNKITEVQTSTESGGKGGPVTTTNTWSYYATFAVGLCQGPIDGVRRIWIGEQLWYDAGSDDLAAIITSNQNADKFTLYLGTDTQNADPLIQADKGVANVPAYRGLAYIVFDTLPLANYGNSLMGAQVKVEIVKDATYSAWTVISDDQSTTDTLGGEFRSVTYADSEAFYEWSVDSFGTTPTPSLFTEWRVDHATKVRSPIAHASADIDLLYEYADDPTARATCMGYGDSHTLVVPVSAGYGLAVIGADGSIQYSFPPGSSWESITRYCLVDNVLVYCSTHDGGASTDKHLVVHDLSQPVSLEYDFSGAIPTAIYSVAISGGKVFVCSAVNVHIFDLATRTWLANTALTTFTGIGVINGGRELWSGNPATGYLYFCDNSIIYRVDADSYAVTSICTSTNSFLTGGRIRLFHDIGDDLLFCRRIPLLPSTYGTFHVSHAQNILTHSAVALGDIVESECLTSNIIVSGDLDVTELDDLVRGYRVTNVGAIRGGVEPLRAAWPFDVVQHGYQIKFVRRGGSNVVTIPTSLLDARVAGAEPGVQVTDAREMDLMIPRKVSVNYVDVTREYDTNQQSYERVNTDAVGERAVDLPIVFSAAEAAQTAEVLNYLYWMERHDVEFVLPPVYADLEPADVLTITGTGATWELRLVSTNTLPDGRIECRAKYNRAALYAPVALGEEGQSTGSLLTLAGPCAYSLLDIPLMRDDDDTAGFPVAMSGYNSDWPGGVLYRSDDGGQTWADLRAFTPGTVIGYASTKLTGHGGTVYDFASTLTVRVYSGTLSSVTEAQLFAGQNWFAYGADGRWEIIAARTATLQGDGSYVLQDFLRGQRGTEWATGLHALNDTLVLLSATALGFISVNSSSIGISSAYRAITAGAALDSDTDRAFTYTGVNLECLSPTHLTGNRHPSTNDWTLTWTRRSRYGDWRDYIDAPLGEASESYVVEVYSSSAYTTLKRTLTATSQTVAYTSAQQVTDFGSNQSTLYVKIYQLSATVGRGYPLTQSITR